MENIVFYFSSMIGVNTGKGGAYYSLLAYQQELAKAFGTQIIHYNELSNSTVLDAGTNLLLKPNQSFFQKYSALKSYFKSSKPVALFSFSQKPQTLLVRWFCFLYGCKYIYVRAGGGNYRLAQFFNNIIFYSEENLEFCKGKQVINSFLVSNRVESAVANEARMALHRQKHQYGDDVLKVLRVSRLNSKYLPTFTATINQHKQLQQMGIPVLTHLIGFEEEKEVGDNIRTQIAGVEGIELFTDNEYTTNTKELIPFYDVVVGIGRGFWEAVSCGKPVFGFAANAPVPVLVTPKNIDTFIQYNFSARVQLPGFDTYVDNFQNFKNEAFTAAYKADMQAIFDDKYSSKFLLQKLKDVIKNSSTETLASLFKSWLLVVKKTFKKK